MTPSFVCYSEYFKQKHIIKIIEQNKDGYFVEPSREEYRIEVGEAGIRHVQGQGLRQNLEIKTVHVWPWWLLLWFLLRLTSQ